MATAKRDSNRLSRPSWMNTFVRTATTRAQHMRGGLCFGSDATDAEWAVLEPLLPAPAAVGRPARWPMREIVNLTVYVLRGGIPWRMLPPCFAPRQTVYGWFAAWRDGAVPCCVPRAAASLLWNSLSPTTPVPATGWRALPASPSRSFASLPVRSASPCIRAAGSSSDASPGSAATAGAGWNGLRHPSHHLVRRDRRGTHLLGAALLAVAEAKSSPV